MKTILIILMCFILSCPAFAGHGRIQKITDGDPAPFSGYIIDGDQEAYFRQINEEYKLEVQKSETLSRLNRLNEEESKYYKESYIETKKELDKEQKLTVLKCAGAFAGGILLTLGVGWIILLGV